MKYDLFISDFDGTLGEYDRIDESTVKAIKEYESRGGIFTIVTGRSFASISGIARKYGLKGKIVGFQGSLVADIESGKIYMQEGVDFDTALKISKILDEDGLDSVVWIDDVLYYANVSPYVKVFVSDNGVKCQKVDSVTNTIEKFGKMVNKVCAFASDDVLSSYVEKYSQILGEGIIVNSGGKRLIEFINSKYNKGYAVEFLSKEFSIPFEKIIAVGDSTNDLPLMDKRWHCVAVGDGSSALKNKAKEITVPFSENPVKVLLEKYCLKD